jgi:hypothetical protein
MGDTRPMIHFDTPSATRAATMKAPVPEVMATISPPALASSGDIQL